MFLPANAQSICGTQYTKNEKGAEWQMNAIPIGGDGKIYFPRPFLIVGICKPTFEDMPQNHTLPPLPYWPMVYFEPADPVDQNEATDLCFSLFLEMALATMRQETEGYPVNYVAPGTQATNFRGYFTQYLSDPINGIPTQWIYTFLSPPSLVKKFHELNETIVDFGLWNQRYQEFISFLGEHADQRLYGSPGIYSIGFNGSQYEWQLENDLEFFVGG